MDITLFMTIIEEDAASKKPEEENKNSFPDKSEETKGIPNSLAHSPYRKD
jgi:hypothetical protein